MKSEFFMRRCFTRAANGHGRVSPNPLVGAVLVVGDKIVAEGYHREYGGPHAEVNALAQVSDPSVLKKATLYVNLEPCSHHGKTPPCSDLIIAKGIKQVVVGQKDPNPLVEGRGIAKLRDAGVSVQTGVLENEAHFLNRRFNTFHTKKRPYIILKWAVSADGFMDRIRTGDERRVHWISHPEAKKLVHLWRSHESAILVGRKTVENDNPSLTVREIYGQSPQRIAISREGNIPSNFTVMADKNGAWIYNQTTEGEEGPNRWIKLPRDNFFGALMDDLYARKISSVLVEGGANILTSFIESGLWDEARVITSPVKLGDGLSAPTLQKSPDRTYLYGKDRIEEYYHL